MSMYKLYFLINSQVRVNGNHLPKILSVTEHGFKYMLPKILNTGERLGTIMLIVFAIRTFFILLLGQKLNIQKSLNWNLWKSTRICISANVNVWI